jgi:hypothetical protein
MIEMKCPACGAGGRAPRDKIGARLVCKKCLRVFHLTPSGQAVSGEPPQQKEAPKEHAERDAIGFETPQWLETLANRLSKLRLPEPRTLGIIGAVALVLLLGFWLFSRQSLEKRARAVAQAIISTNMKQVIDLTAPGTENDAIRWYAETYQRYLALKLILGKDAEIRVGPQGDSHGNTASVIVVFSQEGKRGEGTALVETTATIPSLSNTPTSIEVPLFFVVDNWGNWVLDGKRTADSSPPSPPRLQPAGPTEAAPPTR